MVPNLVNTVKGFAARQKQVLTEVSGARSRAAGASNPQQAPEAPSIELRARLLLAASR
jgi:LemA protein